MIGSHVQRLHPVPVSKKEDHEWCEWMKSGPVTAINSKCYEWIQSRFSGRETVFLNNINTVIKPVQAVKDQKCELYKYGVIMSFSVKRSSFLKSQQINRINKQVPKGIAKQGGTK